MKRIIYIVLICIILLLSGCSNYSYFVDVPVTQLPNDTSPEEVVRIYLKYLSENNKNGILSVLLERQKAWRTFEKEDFVEKLEVYSIESVKDNSVNSETIEEFGSENVSEVKVSFKIKYKYNGFNQGHEDKQIDWNFWLIRESPESPWKIYDWGI